MKRLFCLVLVLAVTATCLPAMAQENEQSIFVVRSRDVGDAPQALIDLCNEKSLEVPTPGVVLQTIPLNAEFWSLQTRGKDGLVKNEFVKQVGTAAACGFFVATGPESIVLALYGDSEVSGLTFEGLRFRKGRARV